jgi:hypothetical protein
MKYFAFLLLLACSCASDPIRMKDVGHLKPGALSHISLGQTKADVVRLFGPSETVSADATSETLYYVEERPWWNWQRIAIVFTNGAVASYGPATK